MIWNWRVIICEGICTQGNAYGTFIVLLITGDSLSFARNTTYIYSFEKALSISDTSCAMHSYECRIYCELWLLMGSILLALYCPYCTGSTCAMPASPSCSIQPITLHTLRRILILIIRVYLFPKGSYGA